MMKMTNKFPKLPGVYIFKNVDNLIIYIGKAKDLHKRVSSYFKKDHTDWKILELVKEQTSIEHIITKNEIEALLLEAQLILKFKPKYNVLLKSGDPFFYILVTNAQVPKLKLVRTKKEQGSYFGPFLQRQKARKVYEYLLRKFRLRLCNNIIENGCLDYHLDNCAGSCTPNFDLQAYINRVNLARAVLNGNYEQATELIKAQIKQHNEQLEFEKSKNLAEYLENLTDIFEVLKTGYSQSKYKQKITAATLNYKIEQPLRALEELQILLNLNEKPRIIDCFDISHFQSSYIVGSCVRFTMGIPEKNKFRRFRIKSLIEQNDYAALQEIVSRRYRERNDLPDIILIDGGKGQLSAINQLELVAHVPCISLAKKEETLFTKNIPLGLKLDIRNPMDQLLISIRDYAHHFAISYHKLLRNKKFMN